LSSSDLRSILNKKNGQGNALMHATLKSRTAAEALVDQLVLNGVEHVFCVPGESYLRVLDELRDRDVKVTVCRQEGGAAMMAEAIGKATGRPGICFVTRGPGATNASAGIHIAQQDSTPVIMFVGQVERSFKEREAFQELDYRAVFGSMTKWTAEVDDPSRVTEFVSRAFYAATSGRPGPVVLALPKDVLDERVIVADAPPFAPVETSVGEAEMEAVRALLAEAERPLFVLGGSRWTDDARSQMQGFAGRSGIAVATSYRRLPLFDPLHPLYAGDLGLGANPKLVARVKSSDLIVLVGGRLGEIPSQGYSVLEAPAPQLRLVHVHPGAEELGRVYRPHLAINASPTRFVAALARLNVEPKPAWRTAGELAHAEYLAWSETATAQPGNVNLGEVMTWLRDALPSDAILCNGAGNYASWIHRFYRFRAFATHIAPTSASMGYGVPAAVAMKRLYPQRKVISINGDGDFLMNGQEFATAVQYDLPIIVIVCDNGMYGTIRMHQEREFPGRVSATDLRNPDFAALARAFGGFGATVERTEDFPAAFRAAEASGQPSIVHLKIDPDAVLPATTLSAIRERALATAGRPA
jgi:acetolactate synthase-1/2/3 large subunit